jgi:hypothetical protein
LCDGQHIWLLTFLVLFVSRQKEHNVYTELLVGYGKGGCIIKVCWLRSREAALLETQLHFVPACAKPLRRRHGAHAPARPKTKLGCLSKSWKEGLCGRAYLQRCRNSINSLRQVALMEGAFLQSYYKSKHSLKYLR